jgi:hypothetical protein
MIANNPKKQIGSLTIIILFSLTLSGFFAIKNEIAAQSLSTENNSIFENVTNIKLGKPLFVESYKSVSNEVVHINGINATRSSFLGSGTLKNISVTAIGSALASPKFSGGISLNGSVLLTSNSGKASYTFEAIGYSDSGKSRSSGATFFDGNATGNLGFLANTVGIYKTQAIGDLDGTFVMWEWN